MKYSLFLIPLLILVIVLIVYFNVPQWHTIAYIVSGTTVATVAFAIVAIITMKHKSRIQPEIIYEPAVQPIIAPIPKKSEYEYEYNDLVDDDF